MKVEITNTQDDETYIKEFESYTEARHWIINHLDCSKEWNVVDITNRGRLYLDYLTNISDFEYNKKSEGKK